MMWYTLGILFSFIAFSKQSSNAISGSVELDELNFQKVIKKFSAALIKFDIAYPYGEKHENFLTIAREAQDLNDLLVGEVGVKDYGENDNEGLANKYGIKKEDFPVILLFKNGDLDNPISFVSEEFTTDDMRKFVIEKTGYRLTLPGCIQAIDELVYKFMEGSKVEKSQAIEEVEKVTKELDENEKKTAKVYKLFMEKILEKGESFIDTEMIRTQKLRMGKVSEEKKKELITKENIIRVFNQARPVDRSEL